jgi:hypothetical protein
LKGVSRINNRFSAGVYGPRDDQRKIIPMVSLSKVFLADVMAILKFTEILMPKNVTRTRIRTYSDSTAAIAALALVWECTQALEKQSGSNKVTLEWIPEHHGIPGN